MKINLLLCGSFNPITKRHLDIIKLANLLLTEKGIEVETNYISPVNDQYHLQKPTMKPTIGGHRLEMIKLALLDHDQTDNIDLHLWEYNRDQWELTRDVMDQVAKESPWPLYLLCGADLLVSMNNPKYWSELDLETITGRYGMVCVNRDQTDLESQITQNSILEKNQDQIILLALNSKSENNISSSRIRKAILDSNWNLVEQEVYPSVIKYLKEHQLYQ